MDYASAANAQSVFDTQRIAQPQFADTTLQAANLEVLLHQGAKQNEWLRDLTARLGRAADQTFGGVDRPVGTTAAALATDETLLSLSQKRDALLSELQDIVARF